MFIWLVCNHFDSRAYQLICFFLPSPTHPSLPALAARHHKKPAAVPVAASAPRKPAVAPLSCCFTRCRSNSGGWRIRTWGHGWEGGQQQTHRHTDTPRSTAGPVSDGLSLAVGNRLECNPVRSCARTVFAGLARTGAPTTKVPQAAVSCHPNLGVQCKARHIATRAKPTEHCWLTSLSACLSSCLSVCPYARRRVGSVSWPREHRELG